MALAGRIVTSSIARAVSPVGGTAQTAVVGARDVRRQSGACHRCRSASEWLIDVSRRAPEPRWAGCFPRDASWQRLLGRDARAARSPPSLGTIARSDETPMRPAAAVVRAPAGGTAGRLAGSASVGDVAGNARGPVGQDLFSDRVGPALRTRDDRLQAGVPALGCLAAGSGTCARPNGRSCTRRRLPGGRSRRHVPRRGYGGRCS